MPAGVCPVPVAARLATHVAAVRLSQVGSSGKFLRMPKPVEHVLRSVQTACASSAQAWAAVGPAPVSWPAPVSCWPPASATGPASGRGGAGELLLEHPTRPDASAVPATTP